MTSSPSSAQPPRPPVPGSDAGAPGARQAGVFLDDLVEVLVLVLGTGVIGEVARIRGLDDVIIETVGVIELVGVIEVREVVGLGEIVGGAGVVGPGGVTRGAGVVGLGEIVAPGGGSASGNDLALGGGSGLGGPGIGVAPGGVAAGHGVTVDLGAASNRIHRIHRSGRQ